MFGTREPATYGEGTLADVEKLCWKPRAHYGLTAECRQSNREGELIDYIHEGRKKAAGIVINAGGYSHTSVAIHDALIAVNMPTVEVHISTSMHANFPSTFLYRHGHLRVALRLRHRWLPARNQWPCRQTRRQGKYSNLLLPSKLTPKA